jgi:hypothetical protein
MNPLFDLMASGRRYLLCTCVAEHEPAISDMMSIERGFWNEFKFQSYPDMHVLVSMIAHFYQRMPRIYSDVGVIRLSFLSYVDITHVIPVSCSNGPWKVPSPNARLPLSAARDSVKKPPLAAESMYFPQRTNL